MADQPTSLARIGSGDLDPVRVDYLTPRHILTLWQSGAERLRPSREKIDLCQQVRRFATGPEVDIDWRREWGDDVADYVELALPERSSITNDLENALGATEPDLERVPQGTNDRAEHDADEFELWSASAQADELGGTDFDTLTGKSVEDGEYGLTILPDTADWWHVPLSIEAIDADEYEALSDKEKKDYTDDPDKDGNAVKERRYVRIDKRGKAARNKEYDRDKEGREPGDKDYKGYDKKRSEAAYTEAYERWLADHHPWVPRVIPALDVVPILTRGRGRKRWECTGLVVRTLYDRETLLEHGYEWLGRKDKREREHLPKASALLPRGFGADYAGQGDQLYLYEAFLMVQDTKGRPTPIVGYCVGGVGTWESDSEGPADNESVKLINLCERYGLPRVPFWTYSWGMHHAGEDDPAHYGIPVLWPVIPLLMALETHLIAHNAHAVENAYGGHVTTPNPDIRPEAYLEGENLDRLKNFRKPRTGEISVMPGPVQPFAQAVASPDAQYLETVFAQRLRMFQPDPASMGGDAGGASGHALVVSASLLKTAKRQIKQGIARDAEFLASRRSMMAQALWKKKGIRVPMHIVREKTISGDVKRQDEVLPFNPRWLGENNHKLVANFPSEANMAEVLTEMQLAETGYSTFENVRKKAGDPSPRTTELQVFADKMKRLPEYQQHLMYLWMLRRGQLEEAQTLKATGKLTAGGIPTNALSQADRPQQAAVPGTQITNPAEASKNGAVAGAIGQASAMSDSQALMQAGAPAA